MPAVMLHARLVFRLAVQNMARAAQAGGGASLLM